MSKAGIMATLNSRCTVLAAANPKHGRFDHYKSIAEQINLPPTLMSRFDLIFTLTDKPDRDNDAKVADLILNMRETGSLHYPIKPLLLKKYIAYARQNYKPRLTPEARAKVREYYINSRNGEMVEEGDTTMAYTARQLEAMVRMAEACAKAHLRDEVTMGDAMRAIDLQKECMKQIGYDADTGKIDIDVVEGRPSSKDRVNMKLVS